MASSLGAAEPTSAELFEKRILPIFKSPNPSSCVQCHLAGVDLKDYILPDAEKTFRSLRDQGLIDLASPEKSKIVRLIEMNESSSKPTTIQAKLRSAERAAFLAWISACAADPKLRDAPKLELADQAKPIRPIEVIRHARKDRVLESFENNVWAWRFRCMNCHSEGTPQNDKLRQEHGDRVAWFKKDGPEATLDYLIASRLIDLKTPERSLLLSKPLGEKHGGGTKFVIGDDAYKGFRTWIEDVAAIRGDRYSRAAELPDSELKSAQFGSDLWLKISDCPPAWGEKFLQVRLYAWDEANTRWETSPIAISDRIVSGKAKLWQHTLTLLTIPDSERSKSWHKDTPTLQQGKYRLDIYVDQAGRLVKDWKATLGKDDLVGQTEFRANWQPGYGSMTSVDARKVKK